MVTPCYQGSGSGQFVRLKRTIVPISVSTNTDFQFVWIPGKNAYLRGQTAGFDVGTIDAAATAFSKLDTMADSYRCVAACLRVIYIGQESARKGEIGLASLPNEPFNAGTTGVGTPALLPLCPKVARQGEVVHEVKWIPQLEDQSFAKYTVPLASSGGMNGALMAVSLVGGTDTVIEITGVYEYMPVWSDGLTVSVVPPKSTNSFTDVMRAMGDTASWVFTNVAAPVIKSVAGVAVEAVRDAPQLLNYSSRAMIAY